MRGREREIPSAESLPSGCKKRVGREQSQERGASSRSFIWVVGAQGLGSPSTAFQVALARHWVRRHLKYEAKRLLHLTSL